MTHRHFGLNDRPFAAQPRVESYFAAESPETAVRSTIRCLERAEGIAAVIAAPGMGKTTLLQLVATRLQASYSLAVLVAGHLTTRRSLLQAILHELDYPIHGRDEGDLRLALRWTLGPKAAPLLILCDEAHTLPGRLLEELRLLTNIVRDGEAKVRLLLVGGPALEERLAHPKLEALQQRIAARSYLHPWSRQETREYVRAQIARVGGNLDRLFGPDALEAVFRATDGVPRLINQICDHALVMAESAGQTHLDKRAIELAWSDLQQLPPPAHATTGAALAVSETIEFGFLEDDLETIRLDEEILAPAVKPIIGTAKPVDAENRRFHAEESTPLSPRLFDEPPSTQANFEEEPEYEFSAETTEATPFRPRVARPEEVAESDAETFDGETEEEFSEDEIVFDESNMLRRIETVELHLSDLNSGDIRFEFDPEPTPAPISTPATPNPFNETFLEEEIVLDPFLDQSLEIFNNKPLVNVDVAPSIHRFADASKPVAAPTMAPIAMSPIAIPLRAVEPPSSVPESLPNSIELVYSQPAHVDVRSTYVQESPRATDSTIASAAQSRMKSEAVAKPVDDDMIVLEESEATADRPRAERREYRQLFAKLRRG